MKENYDPLPRIMQAFGEYSLDDVKDSSKQSFEWGSIAWIIEPDEMNTSRVSVGLVTFNPHARHAEHPHLREEQVLYVLSGKGIHYLNGKEYSIQTGTIFHMPPHVRHELINTGDEELRMLIVHSPSKINHLLTPFGLEERHPEEMPGQPFFDAEIFGPILDQLSKALGLSLALLDTNGKCIIKTDNHATMCSKLAEVTQGEYCQGFLQQVFKDITNYTRPHFFFCCCNIASIIIPVGYSGQIMAYLKCGEIFLSSEDKKRLLSGVSMLSQKYNIDYNFLYEAVMELPIEPKSRLYSAAEATSAIANTIVNIIALNQRQNALSASRLSLVREQLATIRLEKALHESGLKLLQSQVNPHFLFNTLNTISHMAYLEGASKASALTRSLSELLRYTLRKTEQLITLEDELTLLRHYIDIQKERFGERIKFKISLGKGIMGFSIPCMILQPLVENAIVHGLESKVEGGTVGIDIRRKNNMLQTVVSDDGVGFASGDLTNAGQNRVGLNSTKSRLKMHFGNNCSFAVNSESGKGSVITLRMPLGCNIE